MVAHEWWLVLRSPNDSKGRLVFSLAGRYGKIESKRKRSGANGKILTQSLHQFPGVSFWVQFERSGPIIFVIIIFQKISFCFVFYPTLDRSIILDDKLFAKTLNPIYCSQRSNQHWYP